MAWRYCPKCNSAMDSPTIRDIIVGHQSCPSCDYVHEIEQHEREMVADRLIERLQTIEKRLGITYEE